MQWKENFGQLPISYFYKCFEDFRVIDEKLELNITLKLA